MDANNNATIESTQASGEAEMDIQEPGAVAVANENTPAGTASQVVELAAPNPGLAEAANAHALNTAEASAALMDAAHRARITFEEMARQLIARPDRNEVVAAVEAAVLAEFNIQPQRDAATLGGTTAPAVGMHDTFAERGGMATRGFPPTRSLLPPRGAMSTRGVLPPRGLFPPRGFPPPRASPGRGVITHRAWTPARAILGSGRPTSVARSTAVRGIAAARGLTSLRSVAMGRGTSATRTTCTRGLALARGSATARGWLDASSSHPVPPRSTSSSTVTGFANTDDSRASILRSVEMTPDAVFFLDATTRSICQDLVKAAQQQASSEGKSIIMGEHVNKAIDNDPEIKQMFSNMAYAEVLHLVQILEAGGQLPDTESNDDDDDETSDDVYEPSPEDYEEVSDEEYADVAEANADSQQAS